MTSPALRKSERCPKAIEASGSERELREANRHMHEFLAVLAHGLRNPLAAIRSALHVLAQQGDDAATREWVRGIMDRQTQFIGGLVGDLLEVSGIEHGKIRLRTQPLDLAQTVVRAIDTVRASVERRSHHLEVTLPPEPVVLNADPDRLEQMLTNLLTNAAKYTEPGGRVWLTAACHGGEVVFRVRDSGDGIDPEMLPHVFDPYWQVDRTLRSFAGRPGDWSGVGSQVGGAARRQRDAHSSGWAAVANLSCAYPYMPRLVISADIITTAAVRLLTGNTDRKSEHGVRTSVRRSPGVFKLSTKGTAQCTPPPNCENGFWSGSMATTGNLTMRPSPS